MSKLYKGMLCACLVLFICLSTGFIAIAQNGTVEGIVSDKLSNTPVELATISLFHSRDSTLADATITNKDGSFSFRIKEGLYYLKANFIGYETLFRSGIRVTGNSSIKLGALSISPVRQLMDDIKITAQKPGVYNRLDKQLYKADQFQSAKGGTALDVIRNLPAVTVNGEGEINLRGASGIQVLVNGKPVLTDAQTILSQLPANSIENIELITAPSSKYDPDGKGGILNITTKKGSTDGLLLSANAQGGFPSLRDFGNRHKARRYGGDLTLNYRKNSWDITASGNYLRNDLAGYREGQAYTETGSTHTSFPSNGERSFHRYNYAGRMSIAYSPDKKNAFSLGLYKAERYQSRVADILYDNLRTDMNTGDTLGHFVYFNSNTQTKQGKFFLGNFDFTHSFTEKSAFTVSFLHEFANLFGNTKNLNLYYPVLTDTIQYTFNTNTNPLQGYRTNLDYFISLGRGKLEAGYQFRLDIQDGDFLYLTMDPATGQYITDPQFSSGVLTRNTIHSVYSQYSGQFDKLSLSGGLRYEYAHRELSFSKDPAAHELDLSNLFPSASIMYQLGNRWKLKTAYSKRVQRARNYELNPFPEREHSETLEQGDPNLLPEFIHLAEAGLIKEMNKGSVFATLYHQQIRNPIQRVNKIYNDTILNRLFTNAGKAALWGLELGVTLKPLKWWNLYAGANSYHYSIEGIIFNNLMHVNNTSWVYSFNLNSGFQISEKWSSQFNLNYVSEKATAQGKDSRFLSPNLSIKRTFLGGRMSAMLQWQNMDLGLLATNEQRITTRGSDFFTTTNYVYEKDMILFHLGFNLNQVARKLKLPVSEFGEKEF